MFIRNSWYVAAWSSEVEQGRTFGRTILGEPIVMFRAGAGKVAALEGRCAPVNYEKAVKKGDPTSNLVLKSGDTIIVP